MIGIAKSANVADFNFKMCKYMIEFAIKSNMRFRAQTLIWPYHTPGFVESMDAAETEAFLNLYISTVVTNLSDTY